MDLTHVHTGIMTWKDGSSYSGQFVANQFHGYVHILESALLSGFMCQMCQGADF